MTEVTGVRPSTVNLDEFAAENGITVVNNGGDLTLTKGSVNFHYADPPGTPTLNGKPFGVTAYSANIMGNLVVPLNEVQRAFGMATAAAPTKAPASATPTPTPTQKAPVAQNIAPNGYFKAGTPQFPVKPIFADKYTAIPSKEPMTDLSLFTPSSLNMKALLDKTPLTPGNIVGWCQSILSEDFKSPSATQFSETSVSIYPNKAWLITGKYDSPNSYGVMLRGNYFCTIRVNGNYLEGSYAILSR